MMEKLKMQTPNLVDKNVEQIGKIFPEVITETKDDDGNLIKGIDFDLLKQKLSNVLVEDENERYRLDWPGKKASLLKANTPITKTLRPVVEESVDFEKTKNLYIEGDNFEIVKILQESYLGTVKMIYTDPPYNTGKDFIYKDNYKISEDEYEEEVGAVDEVGVRLFKNTDSNGRYHSDWLSMMYERLVVGRDLLSDDGMIFISIDGNEIHNLKKICDEVFGEENFVAIISNTNNPKGRSDDKFIATAHEYILVVAKNIDKLKLGGFEPEENVKRRYNKIDKSGRPYREIDLRKTGDADRREDRPNMFYYFYYNEDTETLGVSSEEIISEEIKITPQKDDGTDGRWRWGIETAKQKLSELIVRIMPTRGSYGVFEKDYLDNREDVKPTSSWSFKDVNSERGSEQFIELGFSKEIFPRPKPIGTIYRCLEIGMPNGEEEIVMDFFSGSSTTAHALIQKNAEDNGNRKFIMIQLPEITETTSEAYKAGYKSISDIGKERIRRAGKKIKEEYIEKYNEELGSISKELEQEDFDGSEELKGKKIELEAKIEHIKNLDIGFRVYRTDSSNMKDIFYHPTKITQQQLSAFESNIKEDRTPEDLLTQVILDLGLELSLPIEKKEILGNNVFIVQENALVACFDDNIDFGIVDKIADIKPLKVVFKDASFKDDKDRVNVEERFKRFSPETIVSVI